MTIDKQGGRDDRLLAALWLHERDAAAVPEGGESGVDVLTGLWRREAGMTDDAAFGARLAADGLTPEAFRSVLSSMRAPVPAAGADTAWIVEWRTLLRHAAEAPTADRERCQAYLDNAPLGRGAWPALWEAVVRMREALAPHRDLLEDPERLARRLASDLAPRLVAVMDGVMALELHLARLRGELAGETDAERLQGFRERTADLDWFTEACRRHPVVPRLLLARIGGRVAAVDEALHRFRGDRDRLDAIGVGSRETITAIEGGGSDPHRGGRTTLVFRTAEASVVYKPRPAGADACFERCVDWLNGRGFTPRLETVPTVAGEAWLWQAFVAPAACADEAAVRRFYRRQGGLIALLHALGASDLHRENLIAAGEHPLPVDLETLFHVHHRPSKEDSATYRAYSLVSDSVLATGLLPFYLEDPDGRTGTDLSGVSAATGQTAPGEVLRWTGEGTVHLRAERTRVALSDTDNQPMLDGRARSAADHAGEVEAGFTAAYRIIAADRDAFIALLDGFADTPVRHIVRSTSTYALALEAGHHPDHLGDGLHRDRLLDRFWSGIAASYDLAPVVRAERLDLLADDIPYFASRPDSTSLWDSRGRALPDQFETTALATARRRVGGFGEAHLRSQVEIMKASLGKPYRPPFAADRFSLGGDRPEPGRESYLEAAVRIGDHLAATAIRAGDTASWTERRWVGGRRWQLGPMDLGLYNGLTGTAYFLAYLEAATGERGHGSLADAALASIREMLAAPVGQPLGAFTGRAGAVHLLTHLAALRGDGALMDEARSEAARLAGKSPAASADLLEGAAGIILVLLGVHGRTGDAAVLETAAEYGESLLKRAKPQDRGVAWETPVASRPLAGYAHGAAGIAHALAALGTRVGDRRFTEAAAAGIAYEQSVYRPEAGNWDDLRTPGTPAAELPVAWCNGAAGIGIARLLAAPHLDESPEEDIAAAVACTEQYGFERNDCLCHGDLGNLELLRLAGRGDRAEARLAASFAEAHRRGGWLSGWGHQRHETLGLFTGLSGTGLALLRGALGDRVPSPLWLEGPGRW
ncbi:type 2 lantipeptide synthetase LanM family protein [Glycomyces sp. A-F 0318]|uniref:type 2 lanthipeptide synthetase LanM family protein n=1 Tax=Glycomyces amatae TaxID=2881355 RepID=UPI001E429216|nr:type 2 lanthipeptide synthetase LanM family protein [Glycomyces amatae]MCD0445103.1 type 2 lantipeptide synthetase LanM family protein [Glycomyces amatae]